MQLGMLFRCVSGKEDGQCGEETLVLFCELVICPRMAISLFAGQRYRCAEGGLTDDLFDL